MCVHYCIYIILCQFSVTTRKTILSILFCSCPTKARDWSPLCLCFVTCRNIFADLKPPTMPLAVMVLFHTKSKKAFCFPHWKYSMGETRSAKNVATLTWLKWKIQMERNGIYKWKVWLPSQRVRGCLVWSRPYSVGIWEFSFAKPSGFVYGAWINTIKRCAHYVFGLLFFGFMSFFFYNT